MIKWPILPVPAAFRRRRSEVGGDAACTALYRSYAQRLRAEGLFDDSFYATHSPDVLAANLDPLWHFLRYGQDEGRWPTPRFDPAFYRAAHLRDDATHTPLIHYLLEGQAQGVPTNPAQAATVSMQPATPQIPGRPAENAPKPSDLEAFCTTTGVFDAAFYSARHADIATSDLSPFAHFMQHGWREGRDPSRIFSLEWYRSAHLNGDRTVNPVRHYFETGVYLGLSTMDGIAGTSPLGALRVLSQAGRFRYPDTPDVTVVVVNHNGITHLPDLFASLAALDYPAMRVLVIDNGSQDGSVAWLAAHAPETQVVPLQENIGFADACNLALDTADTQLVAFLNNDTTVDRYWLRALVDRLVATPQLAAVTARIRFFKPFLSLSFSADRPFSLSIPALLEGFSYKKLFVERGTRNGTETLLSDATHTVTVKLPAETGARIALTPRAVGSERPLPPGALSLRANGIPIQADDTGLLEIDADLAAAGQWVINNAGSQETSRDIVGDRGFGEYDIGQYERAEDVDYLCGGSFLINRTALQGRPLFMGDLFAYFEDTELSVRLRQAGYRIGYAPAAITYHKHSATSREHSVFVQRHVERNYSAFFTRKCGLARAVPHIHQKTARLNHLAGYYNSRPDSTEREKALAREYPQVIQELQALQAAFLSQTEFFGSHRSLRIGVYNAFWKTAGGGEAHALQVAASLSRYGCVDLIGEVDFDLDALLARFGLQPGRFRKVLLYPVAPRDTAAYDVFVNASFGSNLVSQATHSFYLVSFPHRGASPEMLHSYTFLPNSRFTQTWCDRWWGPTQSRLLHPLVAGVPETDSRVRKQKLILHVGRFFPDGHSKMQHEILHRFRELLAQHPRHADWALVCAGGLDTSRQECLAYVESLAGLADHPSITLRPNIGRTELFQLYREAALYWHATGFGVTDPDQHPDRFEHFGISVVEAMSAGCIPIVHGIGGPCEIVDDPSFGSCFDSAASWIEATARWMDRMAEDEAGFAAAGQAARGAAHRFKAEAFDRRISTIFAEVARADAALARQRGTQPFAADGFWRHTPEPGTDADRPR